MDYEIHRAISDIQSTISRLDHRVLRMTAGGPDRPPPGSAFFARAMAALHRLRGEHDRADRIEQRAAVNPAMTTVATWAAELSASTVGGLLLELRKQSAYATIAARTQAFVISDAEINKVVVGGEIAAAFVAEGEPIRVQSGALSSLSLTPKKVMAIVSLTEEILQYGVNVEVTVRQLLSSGVSAALDSAFFSTSAASAAAPAGILAGLSTLTPADSTPPIEAMRKDFETCIGALSAPQDPIFVVSPSRLVFASASLPPSFAYPVIASTAVPSTRLVCVDAGALVAAHATEPRFKASRNATLHMENTTPLPIGTPGVPATVAAPSRSAFQENAVDLKATLFTSWALRPNGAAYIDPIIW